MRILIMAQGAGETVCQHPAEPEGGRTQKFKKIRQPAQGEVSRNFFLHFYKEIVLQDGKFVECVLMHLKFSGDPLLKS
jgi:hypothetical protein